MNKLWLALSAILKKLDVTPQILYRVDAVFAASLGSRQRSIANDAISLWNETFGALESVEYSDVLTRSLKRVSSLTDLSAPGLTAMKDSEVSFEACSLGHQPLIKFRNTKSMTLSTRQFLSRSFSQRSLDPQMIGTITPWMSEEHGRRTSRP